MCDLGPEVSALVVVRLPYGSRYIRRTKGHIARPLPKPAIVVHCFHPVLQEPSFDPDLLSILALDLQNQMNAVGQQYDENPAGTCGARPGRCSALQTPGGRS